MMTVVVFVKCDDEKKVDVYQATVGVGDPVTEQARVTLTKVNYTIFNIAKKFSTLQRK